MANTLVTPTWVTNETARRFMNSVKGIANFNRSYDDQYRQAGAKQGYTVQARLPVRFTVSDGQAYQEQDIIDTTVPITLTNQKHVDFGFSSAQATQEIDRVRERYVNPAADSLASAADVLGMKAVFADISNSVGTPGTTPSAPLTYLQAGVKITDLAGPDDGRVAILDPLAMATLAQAASTLFNPQAAQSQNWRKGQFGANQLGVEQWYQDQNIPRHTTGSFAASTPLTNGAGQTGSTIVTDGWAAAANLKKGDVFTIGGVFGVNPLSYVSTGRLQQFSLTADATEAAGAMTLSITPSIIATGSLQTVSAAPADNAQITVWSANPVGGTLAATVSPQSFIWHPDFSAFVMADLVAPNGGARSTTARSRDYGISLRYVEQYQATTDKNLNRLDMLIGAAPLQPRLSCRVVG